LLNDLSIGGQFPDLTTFRSAIVRVMEMRRIAKQFGRELYCNRNVANAQVTRDQKVPQAMQAFSREEKQSVMQWFSRAGPFWEDDLLCNPDDYWECRNEVVTDTAVGASASRCLNGIDSRLVSLTPSSWEYTPVRVTWKRDTSEDQHIDVINHWTVQDINTTLSAVLPPVTSWDQLAAYSKNRFLDLTFSEDSFQSLRGWPFTNMDRIIALLSILNKFKSCFDENGRRTPEGQRIYQDYFTGDKAWFSDSSDPEKREFMTKLTFQHPQAYGNLFCPWHGKVNTPKFRIHFSWPVSADEPLYIVYVGPKITKR